MPISFSAADRLAITRRILNIAAENASYQKSADAFSEQQTKLQQVDVGNKKFQDAYEPICKAYEDEVRFINGIVADVYTDSDVTTAGQNPTVAPFFPPTPTPGYSFNIPLIQEGAYTNNKVRGYFHPTSTDSRYEQNILTNTDITQGLTEIINLLLNGISYGSATALTQNPVHLIPGGVITDVQVDVDTTVGFSVNDMVYIHNNTGSSGLYIITAKDAAHLTLSSIIPSATGFTAIGATIENGVVGFTNTERQNLTSTNYQELLTSITVIITSLITEWETKIDGQIAITNPDDRSPQASENATAHSDVVNTKSIIDTWQALSNTGVNGKYVNSGINPISAEVIARQSFASSRITQITTALGGSSSGALSQSGDTYSTSSPNNPYFNRYKWLNFRINRATGSLRRYYAAGQSGGSLQTLMQDNTAIQGEYNNYFLVKAVAFNDGSDILHLTDLSGLNPGDTITVVSETQPEISRTIISLMGTTQIKLNSIVPTTYTLEDRARIFKTL